MMLLLIKKEKDIRVVKCRCRECKKLPKKKSQKSQNFIANFLFRPVSSNFHEFGSTPVTSNTRFSIHRQARLSSSHSFQTPLTMQ